MTPRTVAHWSRRALAPLLPGKSSDRRDEGVPALKLAAFVFLGIAFFLNSCATVDRRHQVIISIPEQRMAVIEDGAPLKTYPVSTSKFGLGDLPGTSWTPLGRLEIAQKIGGGAPSGAVFKDRRRTGDTVLPDTPGRDPIVSRILWLRGEEPQNELAYSRYIYIHGTPEERSIGLPVSYGCVRMRSRDVIELFDIVGRGAQVRIENAPLESLVPGLTPVAERVVSTQNLAPAQVR